MQIKINGELFEVRRVWGAGFGETREIECDGASFILAPSREAAGEAARERWADMAENDPGELACMIGSETLISWGLGQYAGPGYTKVRSLSEWLDLWLDTPEEELASYDGEEREVDIPEGFEGEDDTHEEERARFSEIEDDETPEAARLALLVGFVDLVDELGFVPTVAYRTN